MKDNKKYRQPARLPAQAKTMRLAGLIAPFLFLIYAISIYLGYVKVERIADHRILVVIFSIWINFGAIQFFKKSSTVLEVAIRLIIYHTTAGSTIVFLSALNSPMILLWVLLIVASYTYFSTLGVQLSLLALTGVVFADSIYWHDFNIETTTRNMLVLMGITATSMLVIYAFHRAKNAATKKLEESKAQEAIQKDRMMAVVSNMLDAVISTDKDGIIKVYNSASLDLLDTNNSLNGRHIDNVLKLANYLDQPISLFHELTTAKSVVRRDDLIHSFENGEKIRLEITYTPIRSAKRSTLGDGYVIIIRDITKVKSLEEERDEFISVISHELRTPITTAEATISNVQFMINKTSTIDDRISDNIDLAHEQIMFLANMVNDLSALSRAERGVADTPEEIDVRELGKKLADKYLPEAKHKNLYLKLAVSQDATKVFASRLYLEEILQNFLTNAIKYTKSGGVTIDIRLIDKKIKFAIQDTGIGISKTDQSKIYDKFYRSEDYRTRETGGTGLGLYVAAKLARHLKTKIELDSKLNSGSTFSISLPIKSK